jgi:hypothetical protein
MKAGTTRRRYSALSIDEQGCSGSNGKPTLSHGKPHVFNAEGDLDVARELLRNH